MPELNLKQIEEKLENEFASPSEYGRRKIIFWYDAKGDFKEDIKNFKLENARIHELTPTNQFATKVLLERTDPDSNYLIYAPFEKPKPEDNHLEDTYLYSKPFIADRISLILSELQIPGIFRADLEKYSDFFRAQSRVRKFSSLGIKNYSKPKIEKGIIQALTGGAHSFRDALRKVLTEDLKESKYLKEYHKYHLKEAFWNYVDDELGYESTSPGLEELVKSLFVSTLQNDLALKIAAWAGISPSNPNNAKIFLESLRDNRNYEEAYERIVEDLEQDLNLTDVLKEVPIERLTEIDLVPQSEKLLIDWIRRQLLSENVGATIGGVALLDLIKARRSTYYGSKYKNKYDLLESAARLIDQGLNFKPDYSSLSEAFDDYRYSTYKFDQWYRKFYTCFDELTNPESFRELRDLVENIYTNLYLEPEIRKWNELLLSQGSFYPIELQRNLFNRKFKNLRNKTVIIISDGLRYEIAAEIFDRLRENPKYTAEIGAVAGMLPSYTRLAMSAMLPHNQLELKEEAGVYQVEVDGVKAYDLKVRDKLLKEVDENNCALSFDEVAKLSREQLRERTNGKNLIYLYHNQVDARGDKQSTQDEVFKASSEAVDEILRMIKKLSGSVNIYNFIITADHGFLYKRDELAGMEKIPVERSDDFKVNKRYIISKEPIKQEGVISLAIKNTFNNDSTGYLNFPLTYNIFRAEGAGLNYVHGGSSPQETVVPVIELKVKRNKVPTRKARISLFSRISTITSSATNIAFKQDEPVGPGVEPERYVISIIDGETGTAISNTNIYTADSTDLNSISRQKTFKFDLAARKYERTGNYYIVAKNEEGMEILRERVEIDLPFYNDFGFNF